MNTNDSPKRPRISWLRWFLSIVVVLLGIALVVGGIGGWYVWEQINRENLQPTLDGRGESESFKLSIGGGESDLQLDFVRTSGEGGVALAFPFGCRTCTLMLDVPDPSGKPVSGLDLINGKRFHDSANPTRISNPILRTGTVHHVNILSLRDEVRVTVDGELLIHFEGPNNAVATSPVFFGIPPAQEMLVAIDCKIRVYKAHSKMAKVWSPFPKEAELGAIDQIPGEGQAEDVTGYAMRIMGSPVRLYPASKLIDFQEPFTLEFWYRRTENKKKWLGLTSGSIHIELDNSEHPEIHFGHGGGGNFAPTVSTLDTNWHHIAVSNDGYYLMLYLDGQYVCRGNTAYFYEAFPSFRIGDRFSKGHRSSGFEGDIREIRISSIDRYPMGHAFNAPEILGNDEHTLVGIRFEADQTAIESTVGKVQVLGTQMKTVSLPSASGTILCRLMASFSPDSQAARSVP